MRNVWSLMESGSDTVTDVLLHDTEAGLAFLNKLQNCFSDHCNGTTRRQRVDASVERIESALRHIASHVEYLIWFADDERLRLIAMPSVHDRRQINIDDVARPEFVCSGNAVADDVVDADATAFGIRSVFAWIAQAGRRMSVIKRIVVHQLIDASRLDSGGDMRANKINELGIEATGQPHLLAIYFG